MADDSKTNQQITEEGAVRALSDPHYKNRLKAVRRLQRWPGDLPSGAKEKLQELSENKKEDSLVRIEAYWVLKQRGLL